MRILVTGANGQLGRELRNLATPGDGWVFSDVTLLPGQQTLPLDICNPAAVESAIADTGAEVIVNCAGYTDVERAENDREGATALNCTAPGYLAAAASRHGCTLIHISTDFVFPGDGTLPLREDAPKSPLNVYGSTKLLGEQAVLDSGCSSIILRTAWLYSPYGRNFVKTMLRLFSEKEEIRVVRDERGCPTSASDLAGFIRSIASQRELQDHTGVYHYAGEGSASRYELSCAIRDCCGSGCRIVPCLSSEFPTVARRPKCSVLDKSLVKDTFGISIPHWRDSLLPVVERILGNA